MPELPEVETIVQKLQQVLPGKVVSEVKSLHPKTVQGDSSLLTNQPIKKISRRAKIIRIHLPDNLNILIHLKMTGQLIYVDEQVRLGGGHPTADWIQDLPAKHTRVVMKFTDGSTLFFNDQRLFGWWKIVSDEESDEVHRNLGPDTNQSAFNSEYLAQKLKNKSVPIKVAIMDNAIVCGLGNIYAADALNLARLHPERPAKSLNQEEIDRLVQAAKQVIDQGIKLGGTTFDGKYVDIEGMAGKYQSVVRVYGREGKECLNCQGVIVKSKLGGRGTYYCAACQI